MKTVLFFHSPSCAPCRVVKPIIYDMMDDYTELEWKFIDTSQEREAMSLYNVQFIPTMIAVNNKEEIGRHSGSNTMGYFQLVRKLRNHGS